MKKDEDMNLVGSSGFILWECPYGRKASEAELGGVIFCTTNPRIPYGWWPWQLGYSGNCGLKTHLFPGLSRNKGFPSPTQLKEEVLLPICFSGPLEAEESILEVPHHDWHKETLQPMDPLKQSSCLGLVRAGNTKLDSKMSLSLSYPDHCWSSISKLLLQGFLYPAELPL